jgi:hypothetical protein
MVRSPLPKKERALAAKIITMKTLKLSDVISGVVAGWIIVAFFFLAMTSCATAKRTWYVPTHSGCQSSRGMGGY